MDGDDPFERRHDVVVEERGRIRRFDRRLAGFLDPCVELWVLQRQVLIEATVAEVQLNNQYQRGIDWQRLRSGTVAPGVPSGTPATTMTRAAGAMST